MTTTAVEVSDLGKRYRINASRTQGRFKYRSLREELMSALISPLRAIRQGAALGNTESFWALRDLDFRIEPGETVGIIGRNGAGKSTLLKILSRITGPTTGRVRLHGRVGSLLEVGTGFHPELTGRENIYLNGAILGMKRQEIRRKFDEIVAFSEIEKFLETPVKRYSSGMYVRLAFAVAAHLEPEILVVDEVLAVGDAAFQKKCLNKMEDVGKVGRTVLFVSHNMPSITRPVEIVIEFEVVRAGHVLVPNYKLVNAEGTVVFGSRDLDSEWRGRPREPGTYRSTCWIPGNLLTEGTHYISVAISTMSPLRIHANEPDVVAFEVVDELEAQTARGEFAGSIPGVVRPLLEWKTEFSPSNARKPAIQALREK